MLPLALLDASGSTVASYAYDPYGKILSSEGTMAETNPLRYRGYYYDAETGLYYLQSRYVPLRNTMTQMTDGGPRDRRYYIESLAKKYSLDTENTCSRSTGVRYTASTPTSEINSKKYALGIAKVEKGKIATTSAFPDAAKIRLAFATVDFAGIDSSISVPVNKNFSSNLYLDGIGVSFTGDKYGDCQVVSSLKFNILEETLELRVATMQTGSSGTIYTTYTTYSIKLWAVALGVIAIAEGVPAAVIAIG